MVEDGYYERDGVTYPIPKAEGAVVETPETEVVVEKPEVETPASTTPDPVVETVVPVPEPEGENLIELTEPEEKPDLPPPSLNGWIEVFGNEFKSPDELKSKFDSLKTELESAKKASEETFANETVKALNDYMKSGGANEKMFLDKKFEQQTIAGQIEQWKDIDPIEVLKYNLKNINALTDEELNLYLAAKNEVELKIDGNKLKNETLNMLQTNLQTSQQQEADMVKAIVERQKNFIERVGTYVNELKEVDAVKVSDKDKQNLSRSLSNPNDFIRRNFPLDENGLPTKLWVENAARLYNSPRLATTLKNRVSNAQTQGAKEVFSNLSNIPKPEAAAQKAVTAQDLDDGKKILENLKNNSAGGRHYN